MGHLGSQRQQGSELAQQAQQVQRSLAQAAAQLAAVDPGAALLDGTLLSDPPLQLPAASLAAADSAAAAVPAMTVAGAVVAAAGVAPAVQCWPSAGCGSLEGGGQQPAAAGAAAAAAAATGRFGGAAGAVREALALGLQRDREAGQVASRWQYMQQVRQACCGRRGCVLGVFPRHPLHKSSRGVFRSEELGLAMRGQAQGYNVALKFLLKVQ